MSKEEFYIGYQEKAPEGQGKFIRKWIYLLLGIVIITAVLFSVGQAPFVDSNFELGNAKNITGTFYHAPYPMLRTETESGEKDIMLVGFGKYGADEKIEAARLKDAPMDGQVLDLEGTMIYYENKFLFQLQPNLEGSYESKGNSELNLTPVETGAKTLEGEIVDPKCYFGVMKPGYGKIHRSCATRCLSGGIPPVFVTTDLDGNHEYHILTDLDGNRLKKEVLPFVGQPAQISGTTYKVGEWNQIRIDPSMIVLLDKESEIYN